MALADPTQAMNCMRLLADLFIQKPHLSAQNCERACLGGFLPHFAKLLHTPNIRNCHFLEDGNCDAVMTIFEEMSKTKVGVREMLDLKFLEMIPQIEIRCANWNFYLKAFTTISKMARGQPKAMQHIIDAKIPQMLVDFLQHEDFQGLKRQRKAVATIHDCCLCGGDDIQVLRDVFVSVEALTAIYDFINTNMESPAYVVEGMEPLIALVRSREAQNLMTFGLGMGVVVRIWEMHYFDATVMEVAAKLLELICLGNEPAAVEVGENGIINFMGKALVEARSASDKFLERVCSLSIRVARSSAINLKRCQGTDIVDGVLMVATHSSPDIANLGKQAILAFKEYGEEANQKILAFK